MKTVIGSIGLLCIQLFTHPMFVVDPASAVVYLLTYHLRVKVKQELQTYF